MNESALTKVTTFKLTAEMAASLDRICARHGATKDSVIREMISLGMQVDAVRQSELPHFVEFVARGKMSDHDEKPNRCTLGDQHPKTRLGELIETAVARKDIEKQELARHLNIKPASVSKWLRHDHPDPVPPHHWEKITRFLSISWKVWIEAAKAERPEDVEKYHQLRGSLSGR